MSQYREAILRCYLARIALAKHDGHDMMAVKVADLELLLLEVKLHMERNENDKT